MIARRGGVTRSPIGHPAGGDHVPDPGPSVKDRIRAWVDQAWTALTQAKTLAGHRDDPLPGAYGSIEVAHVAATEARRVARREDTGS